MVWFRTRAGKDGWEERPIEMIADLRFAIDEAHELRN
jgi:hypothetical protein